jgi:hypothetical protein
MQGVVAGQNEVKKFLHASPAVQIAQVVASFQFFRIACCLGLNS